mgnify:CR=1 FL=1
MNTFNDLIYIDPHSLTKDVCEEIINRFEKDDRKSEGITTSGKVQTELKKSLDLTISGLNEWKDLDEILFKSANDALEVYATKIEKESTISLWSDELKDNGYTVKKYEPGDYFKWHVDSHVDNGWVRQIAFIWYLNDVTEDGETEFKFSGKKIKPEAGKLILFPASWTYPHRGISPKNSNKYIITSFLSTYEQKS